MYIGDLKQMKQKQNSGDLRKRDLRNYEVCLKLKISTPRVVQ